MTQIDHYVSILQAQHHYVLALLLGLPQLLKNMNREAHSVLPCWIDRQDSLAT